MLDAYWIRQRVDELRVAFIFLTRLPLLHPGGPVRGELSRALWSAPLVGITIGLIGAVVYGLAHALHMPALPAAALAVVATLLVTGGLHEDGLADVADGFGGGATRERRLEIMRDSRIGTYGVCALVLSLLLRVGALASLSDAASVAVALIAAHAVARAGLPAFMRLVPPARADGMSADAGTPPPESTLAATLLGAIVAFAALGLGTGILALLLVAAGFVFMAWLCSRQIQGQTGDVLGASQQIGEITVLLVAAAAMS